MESSLLFSFRRIVKIVLLCIYKRYTSMALFLKRRARRPIEARLSLRIWRVEFLSPPSRFVTQQQH